jgi:hypothetical protein
MADTLELDLRDLHDDDKTPVRQYLPVEIVGFDGWIAVTKDGRAFRLIWRADYERFGGPEYQWIELPRIGGG